MPSAGTLVPAPSAMRPIGSPPGFAFVPADVVGLVCSFHDAEAMMYSQSEKGVGVPSGFLDENSPP
jgi:hypothetical protein